MATIGQQLVIPEDGWIRYDDIDEKISYVGDWSKATGDANTYAGTAHYATNNNGAYYKFTFYGDSFRLIDLHYNNRVNSVTVMIDDSIIEAYNPNNSSSLYKVLVYQKLGLETGVHTVKVSTTSTTGIFSIDAIDIPETGHLCDITCKHAEPLTFHKTLKSNLPETIKLGTNQVHFTEDGGIFINNKTGELKQCNTGEIIKDVSNPLTTSPLEYGYFRPSADINDYKATSTIPFDYSISGNIKVNEDKTFTLKAGISYMINASIYGTTESTAYASGLRLVDVNDSTNSIIIGGATVPVTHTKAYTPSILNGIVTPENDLNVRLINTQNLTSINAAYSNLTIQEIRNNPVNQYGGFETELLFDGNAGDIGDYTLSDDINNYNFIYILSYNDLDAIDITPVMTSNNTPAPYVISARSYLQAGYEPFKAFDNENASYVCWHSALHNDVSRDNPIWIQIDFGKEIECDLVKLTSRNYDYANSPHVKNLVIEGSNDGVSWDKIKEYLELTWTQNETKSFDIPLSKYRYYRFNSISMAQNNTNFAAFGLIKLYKKTDYSKIIKNFYMIPMGCVIKNENYNVSFQSKTMTISLGNVEKINKVIGIKGQLPSLLCGGEF